MKPALLILGWIILAAGLVLLGLNFQKHIAAFLCIGCVSLPFVYFIVCALYPAWGDTKCPKCGKAALRRPDKKTILGVVCDACGYRDDDMYRAYLDEM